MQHWARIRTTNAIERLNRKIRCRTRVVGTFPDGRFALMLVTARLKHIAECEWGKRRYLDVSLLDNGGGESLAEIGLKPDRWQHRGSAIFAKDY